MSRINYASIIKDWPYLGREIPAEKWLQADLTDQMCQTFAEYFEKSRILYTIPILKSEVLVIEITVNKMTRKQYLFSDIIHRAMPYPVLLILNYRDKWYKVSVVASHTNKSFTFREVVDKRSSSAWVQTEQCESLLTSMTDLLSEQITREQFFKRADSTIAEFNVHNKVVGSYTEYEDLIERYEFLLRAQDNTLLKRLDIIYSLFQIAQTNLINFENEETADRAEEKEFEHVSILERFLEAVFEIKDEFKRLIDDDDCDVSFSDGNDDEYFFSDKSDYEEEMKDYYSSMDLKSEQASTLFLFQEYADDLATELNLLLSNLKAESLPLTVNEKTAAELMHNLIEEMSVL